VPETDRPDANLLGRLIRKRRMAAGLSQRALARDARCSQPYLSQIEGGATPSDLTLMAIIIVLDIDPWDLPQFSEVDE
jgi:transcriptional regulator with XRE-family HTH domain